MPTPPAPSQADALPKSVATRILLSAERFALILTQPSRHLRQRVNAWIMTRTRRVPGPITVERRRVYILPTRYGYTYAVMLLVMLLGAMNYSNSMAFALTFLLAALGLIGMHHTHGNLVNVRILGFHSGPVFAGDSATFELQLENSAKVARWTLGASWEGTTAQISVDLAVNERGSLTLQLPAPRRGWLEAPRFSVFTEFPLGLFHAWTWAELDARCLVYPRPATGNMQAPATSGGQGNAVASHAGIDEFVGLRDYQRGDSASRIHWKSAARATSPLSVLQVKEFGDTRDAALWFDWAALPPGMDTETRLSQLTRWVIDAEAAGRRYGLRLPTQQLAPANGDSHRGECLKMLALYEVPMTVGKSR